MRRKLIIKLLLTCSSFPSMQSYSPSHLHFAAMQNFSLHCNSEAQVTFGQFSSSELSPQSLSKSQAQRFCIHLPFLHVNSSDLHVSSKKKIIYIISFDIYEQYYRKQLLFNGIGVEIVFLHSINVFFNFTPINVVTIKVQDINCAPLWIL